MLSDNEIINAIKSAQKEKAIAYLYKTYFGKVKKMVLNRNGNEDDAKDYFQEAVLQLYLNVLNDKLQLDTTNVEGFLMLVAKNKLIDKVRKDKRLDFKEEFSEKDSSTKSTKQNGFVDLVNTEKANLVEQMLSSIGERCYEMLQLSIFHKFTMKEIAAKMSLANEDSAKTMHYKCKAKLIQLYREKPHIKELLSA